MVLQFKFKNHKCFYDETILDFMATAEKRHLNSLISVNDNNILPLVEINGANASGKTSLLDALNFMINMIKFSNRFDVNKDLPTSPFAFSNEKKNGDSEYEISILLGEYEYRYGFSINKNAFTEEWLYKKKFSSSKTVSKMIFERYKDKVNFSKSYLQYEKTWNLFTSNDINTSKMLLLSNIAIKEEKGIFRDIYDFFNKFFFIIEKNFEKKTGVYLLAQNDVLYEKFQEIINEFDPSLLGINLEEVVDDSNNKYYKINGVHNDLDNNQNQILLPIQNESAGTIKIFEIMPIILKNLENGGVLSIDELDIKFHPLLFRKIVNMYKDKKINKNNAQLIYTAHSTFLFNSRELRRDQLYLVEKDNLGKSKLYSLSEFRELRVDADYEKKYLTGQLGAIPFDN